MSSQQSEWFISKNLYLKRKPCLKDTDFNVSLRCVPQCKDTDSTGVPDFNSQPPKWLEVDKKESKEEGNWMLSSLLATSKSDNLKFFIVFICMCNVHMNAHMWRKENNFFDACLLAQASGRSSSGHQSQCQVPLPSEPSHRPLMSHSVMQDQQ